MLRLPNWLFRIIFSHLYVSRIVSHWANGTYMQISEMMNTTQEQEYRYSLVMWFPTPNIYRLEAEVLMPTSLVWILLNGDIQIARITFIVYCCVKETIKFLWCTAVGLSGSNYLRCHGHILWCELSTGTAVWTTTAVRSTVFKVELSNGSIFNNFWSTAVISEIRLEIIFPFWFCPDSNSIQLGCEAVNITNEPP